MDKLLILRHTTIAFIISLLPNLLYSQDAKTLYLNSKEAIGNAHYSNAISLAQNAKEKLGETNPKIESLLMQAYYNNGDLIDAKVAFDKLIKLTPSSTQQSDEFKHFLAIGNQINSALEQKEKSFKEDIEKERLKVADDKIRQYEQQKEEKISALKTNSKEELFYEKILKTGSDEDLKAFAETFQNASVTEKLKDDMLALKRERGRKKAEGEFLNGKRHGEWNLYWANGDLQQIVEYNSGSIIGNYILYIDEEDLNKASRDKSKVDYYRTLAYDDNGNFVHSIKEYYVTNVLKSEYKLKKDNKYSESRALKPNRIKRETIDGVLTNFYPNGNKKEELNFSKFGDLEGLCNYYYENGQLQMAAEFKNNVPYTVISKKWKNGTDDQITDLKNGTGNIVLFNYDLNEHPDRSVIGGGFGKLGLLMSSFSYNKGMKINEVREVYNEGIIQQKYIAHKGHFYHFQYNTYGTVINLMGEYEKGFQKRKTLVIFNTGLNTTYQRLKYNNNQNLVSIESYQYGRVNSRFVVSNGSGFAFGGYSSFQIQEMTQGGLVKSLIAYPNLDKYRRAIPVTGNSKYKAKYENFKNVYEQLVFDEDGLIQTIYIRKKSNNKVKGTVSLEYFTK